MYNIQNEKSQSVTDLKNLAQALDTAVNARFMSPEHGANIWKEFLRNSGLDVAKKLPEVRIPERR